MSAGRFIELRSLVDFADWPETRSVAGDDAVFVRSDGEVFFVHKGQMLEIGKISTAQFAAMSRWYPDPGIFMELNTLREILGWDRTPEDDFVSVYVRRNRNVETVTSGKKSKLGASIKHNSLPCALGMRAL